MRVWRKKPFVLLLTEDCTDLRKYNELDKETAAIEARSPKIQEKWQQDLFDFENKLLQGKIFSKSFIFQDIIHQKTVGLLNISYDELMELMPATHWAINQSGYMGGCLEVLEYDALGRVTLQRERMQLKTPLSGILKHITSRLPIDLTKIEKIDYAKNVTTVKWAVYYSNNHSVEIDAGTLKFIGCKDRKTRVEFESEHRVRVFDSIKSQWLMANILKNFFKKTLYRYQSIANGKLDPWTLEDFSYKEKPVWSNWTGTIKNQAEVLKPATVEELASYVKKAAKDKRKVRVIAGGHSWSAITKLEDGILISLDNLNRVLHVDQKNKKIKVEAGIRLYELNEKLAEVGLGLSVLGTINKQSIAGVISTATHGSGMTYQTIPNSVVELQIMDANGDIHTCSKDKNYELFMAARCALGSIGIITSVTIKCETNFHLKHVQKYFPIQVTLDNLDEFITKNEHFKFWWIPYTQRSYVFFQNRTKDPIKRNRIYQVYIEHFLQNIVVQFMMKLTDFFPSLIKPACHSSSYTYPKFVSHVDRSDKVFNLPFYTKHQECEYAIPVEYARDAFVDLMKAIDEEDFMVGFPCVEVRFVKQDKIYLSPAFERDCCYIGIYQSMGLPKDKFFRKISSIMSSYQGRPHWGKIHHTKPQDFARLYPNWEIFIATRNKMDPKGVFLNKYHERLFGKL